MSAFKAHNTCNPIAFETNNPRMILANARSELFSHLPFPKNDLIVWSFLDDWTWNTEEWIKWLFATHKLWGNIHFKMRGDDCRDVWSGKGSLAWLGRVRHMAYSAAAKSNLIFRLLVMLGCGVFITTGSCWNDGVVLATLLDAWKIIDVVISYHHAVMLLRKS
jgi:hypothetical protein